MIIIVAAIALLSLPTRSFAGEKKQAPARSLADDAAYLTEKSGKDGWASDHLWLTLEGGKVKFKGQLTIAFFADKGNAKGGLLIGVKNTDSGSAGQGSFFELVEEKGKRSIQIRQGGKTFTLEYSIDKDALTLQGAGAVRWVFFFSSDSYVDFTKATPFRGGNAPSRLSADELAAVEAIRKLGSIVQVDDTRPSGTVTTVSLDRGKITDAALKHVTKIKGLHRLEIGDGITDAGLKELKDLPGLQELAFSSFNERRITDAGLKELKELKTLRKLYLTNVKVTDAGLKELGHLTELRELYFGGLDRSQITDAGLKELKELKALQKLHLVNTKVTDAGLKELGRFTELRELSLWGTQVTDAGLKELKQLPNLQELWIGGTKVSEAGLQELKKARPELKINQ
jgi:hypothetical protein